MGILFLPGTLLLAWIFAVVGLSATGAEPSEEFAVAAMRWMLLMPGGIMFVVSGFMHTVFAKSTAKNIGWKTNGFQYELGFVSFGIGIAGIYAAYLNTGLGAAAATTNADAWIILSIIISVFLLGAAANHIKEMIADHNFSPGNSIVLLYDIGLPISLWALLFAMGAF
ncbi:MAG: hypothetical protein K0U64_09940 [Actinomycetia bacterium]|nr:hypothetical protein [Actinomycetes bacterium]